MKKKLLTALLLFIAVSFAGCGAVRIGLKPNDNSSSTNQQVSSNEQPSSVEQPSSIEETSSLASTEESTPEASSQQKKNASNSAGAISSKWTELEFILGDKKFKLPFSYKDLEATGWSFNLADYGYENGYTLNPRDKTYSTINLKNSKYNEKISMKIGFINNDTKAKDIMDCEIWSFSCESTYGFKKLDNVPLIEVTGGITWGTSKADVEKTLGKPKDVYEAKDHGYVVYTYNVDSNYLKLTIYDEFGVTSMDLSKY